MTCRTNVWDADINALRDFQTYRTKEFHYPAQVEQFIENGFRKSNQLSGERLKTELAKVERTRLQQLVRNPLRLMMLCTTWHKQESLPSTKAELYKRFVSEFYNWNKAKWKRKDLNYSLLPSTETKQEKLNKALGSLSRRALDDEMSPFRLSHKLVFDELGDPGEEGSYFWLALNLGWLQVARNSNQPSEKVYAFFHPTFQEYFAALAIDNWGYFLPINHINRPIQNEFHKYEFYRALESQWEEVILLWIGRTDISDARKQKEDFLTLLSKFEDDCGSFYKFRAFFIATECLTEFDYRHTDFIIETIVFWSMGIFEANKIPHLPEIAQILARSFLLKISAEKVVRILVHMLKAFNSNYSYYHSMCLQLLEEVGVRGFNTLEAFILSLAELEMDSDNLLFMLPTSSHSFSNKEFVEKEADSDNLNNHNRNEFNQQSQMIKLDEFVSELNKTLNKIDEPEIRIKIIADFIQPLKLQMIEKTSSPEYSRGFEVQYKVAWYLSQRIPYPDFYQAWHSSISTDAELPAG
ncbi:MAG: hypothetical protein HC840_11080 [Leptolyngbyaceae cyanobacterium RM2_2_4]|nr:hypothetical protein [Leptolyngbyaceae cyanobacterium RM2_2_4]